jgi:hypothetical protein
MKLYICQLKKAFAFCNNVNIINYPVARNSYLSFDVYSLYVCQLARFIDSRGLFEMRCNRAGETGDEKK